MINQQLAIFFLLCNRTDLKNNRLIKTLSYSEDYYTECVDYNNWEDIVEMTECIDFEDMISVKIDVDEFWEEISKNQ